MTQLIDRYFGPFVFTIAGVTLAVALAEALVNLFGISLVGRVYSAGRLLELSAIFLVFGIAQLLRQIRDAMRESA